MRLAQAGYREAVLTGIHLSSYGKDFEEPVSLLDIIRLASGVDGIERIRLGSLEPRIVTEEFVREISAMKKVCPHFHLSLQSGCDATLRRMNRHYTTEEYARCCGLLRKYYSHPAITTDVIVGFPGETEEEFCETMTFLKKIGFYEMHVFKYSRRQGTKAAAMADQVPEELKTERSRIALSLEAELSADFRRYYTGKTEEILLEEVHETETGSFMTGFTREYVKAAIRVTEENKAALVPGQLVKGRFKDSLVTAGGEALEAVLAKKEEGSLCS